MSDPRIYTVGWICAITCEFVAARAFLDEDHASLDSVPNGDNNNYALGRIGVHNVVIAQLADGEIGTVSAATAARDMMRTFENIRLGLMVGVGGGVPSQKHDLRLGDVVVSSAQDAFGAVFQYDFIKTLQERSFQHIGVLNQPPVVLRTAVSSLKAEHELRGHRLKEYIASALDRHPRLRQKYEKPSLTNDRLYRADFVHSPSTATPVECEISCDASALVERPPRDDQDDDPRVHYGTIASANQLMKNAVVRDKLALERGVLCFEMEAAGLMNHFPCLVIRGICDYADSHKNKSWQGYAAMTAAAYSKDLLSRISPVKVESEGKLADFISTVAIDTSQIKASLVEVDTKIQTLAGEKSRMAIKRWLHPQDASFDYKRTLKQRYTGTGSWILKQEAFRRWESTRGSCLWIYGIPGCGKTILCSTIIEHLKISANVDVLLYFYFDFNDSQKQTTQDLARTLIYQLVTYSDNAWKKLKRLHMSHSDGDLQPSCEDLCSTLFEMLSRTGPVWVVLDAIDESKTREDKDGTGVLQVLHDLTSLPQAQINLLITSQPIYDVTAYFNELKCSKDKICIEKDLMRDDIGSYVHNRLHNDSKFRRWRYRPDIQQEVRTTVLESPDTIFRLVACRLDAVAECLQPEELTKALDSLPSSLGDVYNRILNEISVMYRSTTIRMLQLLLYSPGSISMPEMIDAIAVNTATKPPFQDAKRMPNCDEVAMYCSSLVTLVKEDSQPNITENQDSTHMFTSSSTYFLLAHSSVKTHLLSQHLNDEFRSVLSEPFAKAELAEICLAYLMCINADLRAEDIRNEYPFAQHCAQNWIEYAASAEITPKLQKLISHFLGTHTASYTNWYRLTDIERPNCRDADRHDCQPAGGLYYASLKGLLDTTADLLQKGMDPNESCGKYGAAIIAASAKGHTDTVKLLIHGGALVDAQNDNDDTALIMASSAGHVEIVSLLVSSRAKLDLMSGTRGTALMSAAREGHEEIIRIMLQAQVDVNQRSSQYGTALTIASAAGYVEIVSLLLQKGANLEGCRGPYNDAWTAALYNEHDNVLNTLLDHEERLWTFPTAKKIVPGKISQPLGERAKLLISLDLQCSDLTFSFPGGVTMKKYMTIYNDVHNFMAGPYADAEFENPISPSRMRTTAEMNKVAKTRGESLYTKFLRFIHDHVEDIYIRSYVKDSVALLKYSVREWQRFSKMAQFLSSCFRYLDRHYISRAHVNGAIYPAKDLYYVLDLQLEIWKSEFLMKIDEKVNMSLSALLDQERMGTHINDGLIIEYATSLVSFDKLRASSIRSGVYEQRFVTPFLEGMVKCYRERSRQFLERHSLSDYIAKVEVWLEAERLRAGKYHFRTEIERALAEKALSEILVLDYKKLLQDLNLLMRAHLQRRIE